MIQRLEHSRPGCDGKRASYLQGSSKHYQKSHKAPLRTTITLLPQRARARMHAVEPFGKAFQQ